MSILRVGKPRRHLPSDHRRLNRLRPRTRTLVRQERHLADFARPVAHLAAALENRKNVFIERGNGRVRLRILGRTTGGRRQHKNKNSPHRYFDFNPDLKPAYRRDAGSTINNRRMSTRFKKHLTTSERRQRREAEKFRARRLPRWALIGGVLVLIAYAGVAMFRMTTSEAQKVINPKKPLEPKAP
jgi:hypothetical protein